VNPNKLENTRCKFRKGTMDSSPILRGATHNREFEKHCSSYKFRSITTQRELGWECFSFIIYTQIQKILIHISYKYLNVAVETGSNK
jgi:hypothetical protein